MKNSSHVVKIYFAIISVHLLYINALRYIMKTNVYTITDGT